MIRKFRILMALFLAPWVLVGAFGARYVAASPAEQAGSANFTVMVGQAIASKQGQSADWQAMKFYPAALTIHEGDSVTWKSNSGGEPHNVTFLGDKAEIPQSPLITPPAGGQGAPTVEENPLVVFKQGGDTYDGSIYTTSGFMADGLPVPKEYTLTFPKAGTYQYLCTLHAAPGPDGKLAGMVGVITVLPAGGTLPKTASDIGSETQQAMQADASAAAGMMAQVQGMAMPATAGPNGTMVHHVMAGYMDMQSGLEYQRFIPSVLNVKAGDTVEWTSHGFHTVTFGEVPAMFLLEPQTQGPPKVLYNPAAITPAGGPQHSGTGMYNSGILLPQVPPGFPPIVTSKYSLTFAQAGRYEYVCVPHAVNGMAASVVVAAASTGTGAGIGTGTSTPPVVGMPRTGNGDWMATAAVALAILALAAVTMGVRMRKSGRSVQ